MPDQMRPSAALLAAALLASCGQTPEATNESAENAANRVALDAAMNSIAGNLDAAQAGSLVPPAPGEPGGLPDDREPLNEAAARVPTSVEASGATIERFGLALAAGRYGEAYRLWRDNGKQSGMSEAEFAAAYRKYSEIHVLVGRPQVGGTETARVPVQMYGRLREGGKTFNLVGMMTLARNPAGQNGEPGQQPWLIAASELKPLGTVKIVPLGAQSSAARIPGDFQGQWSRSSATCGQPGDDMRLAITGDSLTFYESVGKVTEMRREGPGSIRLSADYRGEGETWSESSTLTLSDGGKMLTIDGVRRVRCDS